MYNDGKHLRHQRLHTWLDNLLSMESLAWTFCSSVKSRISWSTENEIAGLISFSRQPSFAYGSITNFINASSLCFGPKVCDSGLTRYGTHATKYEGDITTHQPKGLRSGRSSQSNRHGYAEKKSSSSDYQTHHLSALFTESMSSCHMYEAHFLFQQSCRQLAGKEVLRSQQLARIVLLDWVISHFLLPFHLLVSSLRIRAALK
jgi:hypothetical protein